MITFSPFLNLLTAEDRILSRGTPHVDDRGLPANHFGNHIWDEARIIPQLFVLLGELVESNDATADAVSRGVVPAHDEKKDVSEEQPRVLVHLGRFRVVHQHEVESKLGGSCARCHSS